MREILFRAKGADNKGWVEGLLTVMWGQYHIIKPSDENTAYPIDTETVCQHTGLTDKNGRRYEGDIFQADNGDCIQIYIIAWDEYLLQWSAECIGDPDGTLPLCEFRVDEIEVIGNIFDTPELLEEGRLN